MQDFNISSNLDYYVSAGPTNSDQDAGISRFDISGITGVQEQSMQENGMNLFPNPAIQNVYLQLEISIAEKFRIVVTDVSGRIIMEQKANAGETQFNVDVSSLANGLYFIEVITSEITMSKKLIKN